MTTTPADHAKSDDATLHQTFQAFERVRDERGFLDYIAHIEWAEHAPEILDNAIQTALSLNLVRTARDLARTGAQQFPDYVAFARIVRGLRPPEILSRRPSSPIVGLSETHKWLDQHAHEYRGKWIAVYNGQLLGSAATLAELEPYFGSKEERRSTIVTQVI